MGSTIIELPSLYPHQEKMRDDARASLAKYKRVILCAPPGTGKTRMAKWIMGSFANRTPGEKSSGKAMFVVHRRGLVDNASNSFSELPVLPHGLIMSGRDTGFDNAVHVASIDTILAWYVKGEVYDGHTFDFIVFDECVAGDSVIDTELGSMRIDEVPERQPQFVRSFSDDRGYHFARIVRWKHSGRRDTIVVHTHVGTIECTPEHEIYTRRGWLQAQFILDTDEILVSVDAVSPSLGGDCFVRTTNNRPTKQSLGSSTSGLAMSPLCADVGAARERASRTCHLNHGGSIAGHGSISTPTGTRTVRQVSRLSSRTQKGRRFSGHYSVTHQSCIRINSLATRESPELTGSHNGSGLSIKRGISPGCQPRRALHKTKGMVNGQSALQRHVYRRSGRFTTSSRAVAGRLLRETGSTRLVISASHGGSVMMAAAAGNRSSCTQRDTPLTRMRSSLRGSVGDTDQPKSTGTRDCSLSESGQRDSWRSAEQSLNTSRSVCDTKWSRVTRIDVGNRDANVYDIEVEDSHCFFANGLLVHNCHAHVPSFRSFIEAHDKAREKAGMSPAYVLGLSATPQHKELAKLFKYIVKGPSPQWLIDNKFLSPFRYFQCTAGDLGKLVRKGDDYTEASVAEAMSNLAGNLVTDWKKHAYGRATIGFFPRRSHAQEAVEMLIANGIKAAYVDGETPDDERRQMFKDMNDGNLEYIANIGVIERGTDIPRVGCVQMCTAVGNVVRWKQMIGRGSRIHPDVPDCIVLDHADGIRKHGFFEDDVEWSLEWGERPAKTHEARDSIECPSCGAVYRGGQCRQCGYEPTPKERKAQGLEFVGGELVEVTRKDVEKKKKKTNEELMVEALYRAGRSGRTFGQAYYFAKAAAEKQGTRFRVPAYFEIGGRRYRAVAYGSGDVKRKVSSIYGVTVGNHTESANPYRER